MCMGNVLNKCGHKNMCMGNILMWTYNIMCMGNVLNKCGHNNMCMGNVLNQECIKESMELQI